MKKNPAHPRPRKKECPLHEPQTEKLKKELIITNSIITMNQKLKYLNFFLMLMILWNLVSAQLTKSDIDKAINISSLKHPYLYFSEQEKPQLIERIQNNPESNDIFRKLQAEAKMWLAMPVDKNIPVQGKNTRAG
jgi:hypothetical protein